MTPVQVAAYLLVALFGTAVVMTRNPLPQALVASLYGLLLTVLFLVLQAPDVAISEIVVGAVAFPLMIMLALAKSEGKGGE